LELDIKHLNILRAIVANETLRKPKKIDDEQGPFASTFVDSLCCS
jgi:hypothetical protein